MNQSSEPPKLAIKLLNVFVPAELQDALIGDLNEEFMRRTKLHTKFQQREANNWFWRQTLITSTHFFSNYLASENLLRKLVLLVTTLLLPTLMLLVFWLSNVDSASDDVWDSLLRGKVHSIVMTSEFWTRGSQAITKNASFGDVCMYLNLPSVIWALTTFAVLYVRNKRDGFSAHQAAVWGTILMFLPYLFGLLYIELHNLDPRQVGPIIAIMTISIIYIILPLTWFVVKKTRH